MDRLRGVWRLTLESPGGGLQRIHHSKSTDKIKAFPIKYRATSPVSSKRMLACFLVIWKFDPQNMLFGYWNTPAIKAGITVLRNLFSTINGV